MMRNIKRVLATSLFVLVAVATIAPTSNAAINTVAHHRDNSSANRFTGHYYNLNSATLAIEGEPYVKNNIKSIDFNWGMGSPKSNKLGNDNFYAMWFGYFDFDETTTYTFNVDGDDGIKVLIDDMENPVFERWEEHASDEREFDVNITKGRHLIVVHYFERYGNALAKLNWKKKTHYNQDHCNNSTFQIDYFNNKYLTGGPVHRECVNQINKQWGNGSPLYNHHDYFSARAEGNVYLEHGTYEFSVRADDGVRVYIDGKNVLTEWRQQYPTTFNFNYVADKSKHYDIKVEYFEETGNAELKLMWNKINSTPHYCGHDAFSVKYYNSNNNFVGNTCSKDLHFDWGFDSPYTNVNADYFSAVMEGEVYLQEGKYLFTTYIDDSATIKIDGVQVFNQPNWTNHEQQFYFYAKESRKHNIKIKFQENGGYAKFTLNWKKLGTGGGETRVPHITSPAANATIHIDTPIHFDAVSNADKYKVTLSQYINGRHHEESWTTYNNSTSLESCPHNCNYYLDGNVRVKVQAYRYGFWSDSSSRQFKLKKSGNLTYILHKDYVRNYYHNYLNREPDAHGLHMWIQYIENPNRSVRDLPFKFSYSPEFTNKNVSNEEFVRRTIRAAYFREPNYHEVQNATNYIYYHGRSNWLNQVVNSGEFRNVANRFQLYNV